jgi:glycosyltransferase involved in cell wall biosynthesis
MASILFLIDELEIGGSQRQILLIAREMIRQGHAVSLGYFRAAGAVMRPDFEAAGLQVTLVPKRGRVNPLFVLQLARFLAGQRNILAFGYSASLWARMAGATPVCCIRNLNYLPRQSRLLALFERQLSRRSRRVVANSQVTADRMVERGILPREKLLVIPNAVETEPPAPREAARARLAATGPMVGTLARLVAPKDLPTLLRAARLVIGRRPEVQFVVGGEGPERASLEALRRELDLDGRFSLPGTLAGRDVIAGLDVAVLSSSAEGMPNFVLEAMAAGVPVVSTRAGAAPELLEEGRLGRLVPIGDHAALAEAILATLDAPSDVAAAAAKVRDLNPAQIARRYLQLF